MNEQPFNDVIKEICINDQRYDADAYTFVREALDFTVKTLNKPLNGPERHISGQELLDGIRRFALQEYGPMSRTLLESWGINKTEDFGEIVFNLVESGKLGKTDHDKREDFANGYNFHEAFEKPFLPQEPPENKNDRQKSKEIKNDNRR
jgi:uncharacterized repeat protein (TIGR04138 family)